MTNTPEKLNTPVTVKGFTAAVCLSALGHPIEYYRDGVYFFPPAAASALATYRRAKDHVNAITNDDEPRKETPHNVEPTR